MNLSLTCWLILGFMTLCGFMYLMMVTAFNVGLFRLSKKKQVGVYASPVTLISVVIPARNEEKLIGGCLEDLLMQEYPVDLYEIIIVDDHSDDGTSTVVKTFAENHTALSITLLKTDRVTGSNKKHAIECALAVARGELILMTDADCRMGSGRLRAFAEYYETHHPEMILGPVTFFDEKKIFSKLQTLEFLSLIASGAAMVGLHRPVLSNGANMAFTRRSFFETGGYRSNEKIISGDDIFLLLNIRKYYGNGSVGFLWNRNALVSSGPQANLRSFMNQRIRWVSKSKGYRDFRLVTISLIVFLFALVLVAGLPAYLLHWSFPVLSCVLWLMKCFVDLPLLIRITTFTKQRSILKYFLVLQMIYPFYIVVTAIWGLTGKFSWKGRNYS